MISKYGVITSAKSKNTVTVTVHRLVQHKLYKKSYRRSKKFLADTAGVTDLIAGDEVRIEECRPLSARKHFKVVEVIKRAPRVSEMAEEAAVVKLTQHQEDEQEKDSPSHA